MATWAEQLLSPLDAPGTSWWLTETSRALVRVLLGRDLLFQRSRTICVVSSDQHGFIYGLFISVLDAGQRFINKEKSGFLEGNAYENYFADIILVSKVLYEFICQHFNHWMYRNKK